MTKKKIIQGIIPFIIFGILWIIISIPVIYTDLSNLGKYEFIIGLPFMVLLASMFVALCVGWIKGFPHWSFPVAAFVLVISYGCMHSSSPFITGTNEILGWWGWIPFIAVALIAIVFTRSLSPYKQLVRNIQNDWTLILFAIYGLVSLFSALLFDEVDKNFEFKFSIILSLIILAGAFFYLKIKNKWIRALSLIIASGISFTTAIIASNYYWENLL